MWSHTCILRKGACLHDHFLNTESLFVHNRVVFVSSVSMALLFTGKGMLQYILPQSMNFTWFYIINPLMDRAVYRWHKTLWCHCWQCLWEIDSAWTERVGQGKEGGLTLRAEKCLGLAAERTWLLLGGPFLSLFTPMGRETVLLPRRSSISGNELSLDRQLSCQEQ